MVTQVIDEIVFGMNSLQSTTLKVAIQQAKLYTPIVVSSERVLDNGCVLSACKSSANGFALRNFQCRTWSDWPMSD